MNLYIVILLLISTLSGVPYVSQDGEGADKYRWDCGPANASMMIENYLGIKVTPDSLMDIIGRDRYTFAGELQALMGNYGLKTEVLTFYDIHGIIEHAEHDPVIILEYSHWVLVTGEAEGKIRYHDSLEGRDQLMDKKQMQDRWLWSGMNYQGIVVTNGKALEVIKERLERMR
jgi:ABC-type bacteriocin/lantibiotic exporter with double-glycine peptidase domain